MLGIPDSKIKQLNSAGLVCVEDLLTFFPRKYIDRSRITGLHPDWPESVFIFRPERIWSRRERTPLIVVSGRDNASGTNRAIIEPLVAETLQNSLDEKYGKRVVTINKVTIGNVDFEDSYNAAIAEKQNAQLAYEKQAIENKTSVERAQAEADAKLIAAQAEADAKLIAAQADAEAMQITAEAEATQFRRESGSRVSNRYRLL